MGQVDVSFVLPAYNEADSIESALSTIDETVKIKKLQYEIVVVNDGSKDETLLKANAYASMNGHVRVVSYNKNMGKGYAARRGFMQTKGEVVIFADSDRDIDLGTVSSYLAALQHGDIVIASKWHPQSVVRMPIIRKILSHGFNILARLMTSTRLRDTQAGLKAMRRSAFKDIFPRLSVKRYAFDVELLTVASLYGLKIVEMPVNLEMQTLFDVREVWRMLVDLLGISYRLRVLRWYQRPLVFSNKSDETIH
jgi:dolichol-phosphate mannosyltransferase